MAASAFARFGSRSGAIFICTAAMVNVLDMSAPLRFARRLPNLNQTRHGLCRVTAVPHNPGGRCPPYYKEQRMSSPAPEKNITSVLKETRVFPPPETFAKAANVSAAERDRLADWAKRDPDAFWAEQAKSLHW